LGLNETISAQEQPLTATILGDDLQGAALLVEEKPLLMTNHGDATQVVVAEEPRPVSNHGDNSQGAVPVATEEPRQAADHGDDMRVAATFTEEEPTPTTDCGCRLWKKQILAKDAILAKNASIIDANMMDVEAWGKPPKHRSHELHEQEACKAPPTCGSHGSHVGPNTPETDSDPQMPAWKQFTPIAVAPDCCMARTWNGGIGGQCRKRPSHGTYCNFHANDNWRKHGRVDGPIPEEKLAEFQKCHKHTAQSPAGVIVAAPTGEETNSNVHNKRTVATLRPRWKKQMLQQSTLSRTLQRHIQASTTTLPLSQRLPKRKGWAILGKSNGSQEG